MSRTATDTAPEPPTPRIRTDLPFDVTHEDVRIPLPDGTTLFARVWRPGTDEPVPVLLEYLPHRLSDRTAPRDHQRHPWYAGHGYASVRVDVRGHGNSEGLPGEAHGAQELADGVEVVNWLAGQPWSTGRVGMFGIGWGGLNSLRIAALAPEPLKAVVTVCATDDRYDNDRHYMGGSVLAVDLHAWAAATLAYVSRPPDPEFVGDRWKDIWTSRLAAVEPSIHTWLSHQTRDDHWRRGSVREDLGAIRAGVLAVGGWHDPYRDTVLRLVAALPDDQVRGIIGPWSHQYPDRCRPPGPGIGFLQETLRWWDHWLKDQDSDVTKEPKLRAWISDSHPPATVYTELPGRWVGEPSWPSPHITPTTYELQGSPVLVRSPQQTGLDAGRFVPLGGDADLPPDQRDEDAKSACFEFQPARDVTVLGRPRVRLRVTSPVPRGQAIARLCDVAPDGSSTLVTRGALNFTSRHGSSVTVPMVPAMTEDITFELTGIGHVFPAGHRIRLAVSSAYWPWIWPQPGSERGFTLDPVGSALELPVRSEDPATALPSAFAEPEQSEPLGVVLPVPLDEEPRPERLVVRDVAEGEWTLEAVAGCGGVRVHPDGLEYAEEGRDTYVVREDDPLSARARSEWSIRLHRAERGWDARVSTRSEISCTAREFVTSDEVVCRDGDEVVFHRTWERRVPRVAG
ncbi:CocE/NonD family hydrolase [Streptomyces sp. NPDC050145]|uniref:CocE/NonD family hydrolase n=1 Tax=Streptomyces sp. NPDC050145 TaxID=3365602 RepID=UPI003788B88A